MSSGVLAVLVVAAWYRRCSDAASTCPSEDDYYIGLSLITYCVFSLVVTSGVSSIWPGSSSPAMSGQK